MSERLTTKEAADLLKVSKRTIIRYAEKHGWEKASVTDDQGRQVTTYDKAEILASFPGARDTVTEPPVIETNPQEPVTEAPDLAPVTMTPDNAATLALQDAVAMIAQAQRESARRITAAIAAAAVVLLVGIGAAGYALMMRHDAQIAAAQVERERVHQVQLAQIAARAKAQRAEMERIEARRALETDQIRKSLEDQREAHREEIRALQGRMRDEIQINRFMMEMGR